MSTTHSSRKFSLLLAGGWVLWSVLYAGMLRFMGLTWEVAVSDSFISNGLLCIVSLLIHINLRFYLPGRDRIWYLGVLSVVAALLVVGLQQSLLRWLLHREAGYAAYLDRSWAVRLMGNLLIIAFMALISVLRQTFAEQQKASERQAETARLAREAELMNLRQQLQPHFLFNSLNSINALIGARPEEARQMVDRLSRFLRSTLRQDHRQWVPLQEELDQLALYLSIEEVRFGNRLQTVIQSEPGAEKCRLPALLLQPVVENAIKFGLYGTTGAARIEVHASIINEELVLAVMNPFDPDSVPAEKGTGFGLSSIRRRLYLLFGRNDLLETETDSDTFIVSITLPQPETVPGTGASQP